MEKATPEVDVLPPQRLVEPERLGEVAVQPCEAVESAWIRLISPSIGFPGIRRGIAQSIVTATKKVSR